MTQRIQQSDVDVCADSFFQTLHREFYERMPDEFRILPSGKNIEPGKFRKGEVEVGAHLAPTFGSLSRFMSRFACAYAPKNFDPLDRIIAAAASHHRFAWIHPFQDGNGRVARLFTHAYLARAGVETAGLWAISRGLARRREDYRTMLANADAERKGSLDGRGNLSNKGLVMFCEFFLSTALDQVSFMSKTLDLDAMQDRIMRFAERWTTLHGAPHELGHLMREAFLRGSLTRGEAASILNKPERTSRRYVSAFIEQELLSSDSIGGPLSLSFSSKTVGYLFPRLYPEGVE
jgi:Fic family protein